MSPDRNDNHTDLDNEAIPSKHPALAVQPSGDGKATMVLSGDWTTTIAGQPSIETVFATLGMEDRVTAVACDLAGVTRWDTSMLAWLMEFSARCEARAITFDSTTLPDGVLETLQLARAVPRQTDATHSTETTSAVARLGTTVIQWSESLKNISEFVGECVLAAGQMFRGRAQFRRSDLMLFVQEAGVEALGISLLISFLVGLILAFVGAVQLQQFGASIYVANLVGIAMVREMGCIMTGIIMCGRTGASYAAQLGTMKVNQEIDAYRTFQFSPIDFLVIPRVLALFMMMPLLTAFANLAGISGGALIGVFMLDLTFLDYWHQTVKSLTWAHCSAGFMKSFVFGIIVAVSGCYHGMRCENNAAGVGQATTSAVVSGITAIIVADAVFAVLFNVFKI